jgi:hypothetical protein
MPGLPMTAALPPTDPPGQKPRRPRPPRVEMDVFGSFTPWKNPTAVYSYGVALAALTPVLGLVLGPVAAALGLIALICRRRRPEIKGGNFAVAGIVLGSLNTLLNGAGVWCVGRGMGWW